MSTTSLEDLKDVAAEAGVIAAKPAIEPVAAPNMLGLPNLIHSMYIQTNVAVAAEICVTVRAEAAAPSAASALPPLKPNQPTHNITAPVTVMGRLCGIICFCG